MTLVAILTVRRADLAVFRAFEHRAASVMRDRGGSFERVIVLGPDPLAPTLRELHIVTFPSQIAFERYQADPALHALAAMRAQAVVTTEVWIGEPGPAYGTPA